MRHRDRRSGRQRRHDEGRCPTKGADSSGDVPLAKAIIGTWEPVKLDGEDVVPEVDNPGTWTFTKSMFSSVGIDSKSGCEQPYELLDVSSATTGKWTRTGTAKWTGLLASNPEPPECPFGYNMPAEISLDGDAMTVAEGVYDPPASGGIDHEPSTIEFKRKK